MNPETNATAETPAAQRQSRGRKDQEKKQKVKQQRAIKPELFQTKKGIRALYENTKKVKFDEYSELNIENTMKKIATVLKNWHSDFVPKYSFDYFLQRCQALGNQKFLSAYMSKVRRIHQGKDTWEEPEQPAPVQNAENAENQENNGHLEHDLNILNGNPQVNKRQEKEEDDEDLMELMYSTEKRAGNRRDQPMQQEEHYVPEGFGFTFPPEQDDD